MKKNALRKDFLMEVRKSMGRFLSVFLIVALGVIILVGLRATQPDMILSGDTYADENRLMDIKVVSTYGLTEDDAEVLERLPDIESATGSYSTDVLCQNGDNMDVIHVMSLTENVNTVTLIEGRMPKGTKECLVDADFLAETEYEIGDEIKFVSGTDEEVTETLKSETFEIVGAVHSPLYFSFFRGSSTVGNGTVSGFVIVNEAAFDLDVYTEIYLSVKDAKEEFAFTDAYDELVEEAIEQIEMIQNVRCEVRRDDLAEMAQLEVDNARKELNDKIKDAEEEIKENEDLLNESALEISLGEIQIENGEMQLETAKALIKSGKAQLESGRSELETTKAALEEGKKELNASKEPYQETLNSLKERRDDLQAQIDKLEEDAASKEGEEAEEIYETIESLQATVDTLNEEITDLETTMDQLFADSEKTIADAEKMIAEGEAELLKEEANLLEQEKELLAQEKKLKSSKAELKDGKEAIEEGRSEIEDAKEELETQLKDAEAEIEDAEEIISEIELPTWYIFDRSSIPDYTGFGDNAARIAALTLVFPSMFFLVAALISLTTMTRMVEEQRIQIGTLKALGYGKFSIIKKYLNYAFYATVGGGIFGVLLGEKLLPYVIIDAYYKTVYTNIPILLIPYRWGVGIFAILIAVFCTCGATLSACYKELISQPAVLMRPEPPKIGKRTLIERLTFIWRRLNFSWKSSLRNLFRYKKRFFMTLLGIGGCMGLLMVGYGLRDSISSIAEFQYGQIQLYDASVFIGEDMEDEDRAELETFLENSQNVENYMDGYMGSITTQFDKEKVEAYIIAITDMEKGVEFFQFRDRKTKEIYELTDEGIIISEKTASLLGAGVGDEILLTESGMNERKVTITAVCENYVSHWVYMTDNLFEELYDKEPYNNSIFINAPEGVERTELEKIGEEILTHDNVLNVQYTKDLVSSLDGMLVALDEVMILLILIAGLLSFVVLYNLNNINITERRRELATLKVLGFYDGEVAMYVYRENILLTLLGTVVGCFMGKFLHYFTVVTVEVDEAMFGRTIFWKSYLICALFTIGFSIIVNAIMYFKLKKIDMVESLKSVE